jgi:dTDP-4-dehydrorhamnose reductase
MKVAVLGASGLVGSHVCAALADRGHRSLGTTRASGDASGLAQLDLADEARFERLMSEFAPEAVVYAAGYTWADGCEGDPDRSRRENFEQPARVAAWCARHGVRLAYCSSSYVFDGREGDYAEDHPVGPINVYGRHKAAAEAELLAVSGGSALILRLICVWGREAAGKNFAYQVRQAAREGRTLRLPSDQSGNPTWAGDIAAWTVALLEARERGHWHLAGPSPDMLRPAWAKEILRGLGVVAPEIVAVPTAELGQKAPRPLRAGMRTDKICRFAPRAVRAPHDLGDLLA